MSEQPVVGEKLVGRRLARAFIWKAKLQRADDPRADEDWSLFGKEASLPKVIEEFAAEFGRRLGPAAGLVEQDSGQAAEFRELGIAYRRTYKLDSVGPDELARECRDDFGKWLNWKLFHPGSLVVPRIDAVIGSWLAGGKGRVGVLEEVFGNCLDLVLKAHPSFGEEASGAKASPAGTAAAPSERSAAVEGGLSAGGKADSTGGSLVPPTGKATPGELSKTTAGDRQRVVAGTAVGARSEGAAAAGGASGVSSGTETPAGVEAQKPGAEPAQVGGEGPKEEAKTPVAAGTALPASAWQYKPVPEGPDKHTEYDPRRGVSPEGYPIIGARVRGKKHKHEGTNCDDWYEFKTSGRWTVLAVSDGGGSYKFSRVGAKLSCQTVVNTLVDALEKPEVAELKAAAKGATPEDLEKLVGHYRETVGAAIKLAMRAALQAVLKRIGELNAGFEYLQEVNNGPALKPLTLRDFYATLLVAVHAALEIDGKRYSFVMGCACGDGMIGVISNNADPEKACTLLMKADSGPNSGETEFLCERLLVEEELQGRMYPGLFGGWKALMLTTDGVADIFFPNNPGITRVYGDLVLNRIVAQPTPSIDEELIAALQTTGVKTLEEFKQLKINAPVYRILESGAKQVEVASLATFAQQLGVEKEKLALNQALLAGACKHLPDPAPDITKPEDRLVHWLDAYTIKGEFDDRTLLVMAPAMEK